MPVQIGAATHPFSDPTGLLSDCHRRIETFLGTLQRVAETIDRPLTADARAALQSSLRYFQEAAPKHTADEEESLFPRLRNLRDAASQNALSTLAALESDHAKANALHLEVHTLGLHCLDRGPLSAVQSDRFRQAISELASIYKAHIQVEDDVVFPAAKQALTASDKSAIAEEMAARRR